MKRPTTTRITVMAATLAVLALAACGGNDNAPSADGPIDLTVGVIPIVDTAPIWLGDQEGFFEEEGINLTIETATGGAALVPGVVSGEYDFAFSNVMSLMIANGAGLPVELVTNGASSSGGPTDFGAVLVNEDSDIQTAADLAGATVSVNNLNNIGDTTIRAAIEADGGDPSSVQFVEIPFPDAPAALAQEQVDAIWVLEPFMSAALADGARVATYNYLDMSPNLDIAGYFTTQMYQAENPEVVERFTRAMNRSLDFAGENEQAVRDVVGTYTEIPDEARAQMVLPVFRSESDRPSMELLGEAAVRYGTIESAPDLNVLLP